MLIVAPSVGAFDPQAHWLLSWKALKGPFSKHELAIQRSLQFIVLLEIAERVASL
jgi:hypothetical protein